MGVLISSNCCSGHYYKSGKKVEFPHPFIWGLMKLSDLLKLMTNLKSIDFSKVEFFFTEGEISRDQNFVVPEEYWKKCPTMLIDKMIKFYFIHHVEYGECEIKRAAGFVYGKDMLKYLENAYFRRLERMGKLGEDTVFLYSDDKRTNDEDISKFMTLDIPYKRILVSENEEFRKFVNNRALLLMPSQYNITELFNGVGTFLAKNTKFNSFINGKNNKKVIYTCIAGPYDVLVDPKFVTDGFDYVCFTDQPFKSHVWDIRPIPDNLKELTKQKQNRYIKTHPHEFFPEYDFSIWADSNIRFRGDANKFIEEFCNPDEGVMFVGRHPSRTCLYKESLAVVASKKDTSSNIVDQVSRYELEGFPKNYGLSQNCMIFRYHNDPACVRLMEDWWKEIKNGSHRDQLSLSYVMWKNPDVKVKYLSASIFNCEYFFWDCYHSKPIYDGGLVVGFVHNGVRTLDYNYVKKLAEEKTRKYIGSALDNPVTLQEKLLWLTLNRVTDLKTECSDKLRLRDYCKRTLGVDLCPKILKIFTGEKLKFNDLPNSFVLKCNHGSGFNIVVKNKYDFNEREARTKLLGWKNLNYCVDFFGELQYYPIKPTIFAEEMLPSDSCGLIDYKFWCFNGEPNFIGVNFPGGGNINYYNTNYLQLQFSNMAHPSNRIIEFEKPVHFEEMKEYARKLSQPFEFVRVDFYESNDRVYLGEMTFTPGAGRFTLGKEADLELGKLLKIKELDEK